MDPIKPVNARQLNKVTIVGDSAAPREKTRTSQEALSFNCEGLTDAANRYADINRSATIKLPQGTTDQRAKNRTFGKYRQAGKTSTTKRLQS